MSWFKFFKNKKVVVPMPEPKPVDNWKTEHFNNNIEEGVNALRKGLPVHIYEDGRGYELAIMIKHRFILEYQKQLSNQIKININKDNITIDRNYE